MHNERKASDNLSKKTYLQWYSNRQYEGQKLLFYVFTISENKISIKKKYR